jgi:hypothetical protein
MCTELASMRTLKALSSLKTLCSTSFKASVNSWMSLLFKMPLKWFARRNAVRRRLFPSVNRTK